MQDDQMKAEMELLRMLAESEDDARNGRVAPVEDTFASIRRSLEAEDKFRAFRAI